VNGIDAGRLVGFGCDVTVAPGSAGSGAEYARLVERYITDAAFRQLVDDFLEGVDCDVTQALPDTGLVIRAGLESPWVWPARSSELPWNKKLLKPEHRAARMLVVGALLAYIAPTAADFDGLLADPALRLPSVTVRDLEQFIRQYAEHAEQASPDPGGEERPLWWHWVQVSKDAPAGDGAQSTTLYLVWEVLAFLNKQGLVTRLDTKRIKDATFRPRRRLLAHYRDLFIDDLLSDLKAYAADADVLAGHTPQAGA
jgi:hypothetical protein